ncbi:acetyltransferase family protein, partial [Vibrio parahaemolyticus V-223/04]
MIALFQLQ